MWAFPGIPWDNPGTAVLNEDGQLTPPPSPILIAHGGHINGINDETNDDIPDASTTLDFESESQPMVDDQPMTGAMSPSLADDESMSDESRESDGSVGGPSSLSHDDQLTDLIVHTAAGDINVHRDVLSHNEIFSRLLVDSPTGIDMRGENPSAVEVLLHYLYNPHISISLSTTPITHFPALARLAERFAIWDLAIRAEEAIPVTLHQHSLPEFVAGFRDAFLAEEVSDTNRAIQNIFLDEACSRMSALVANAEFMDFLDSQHNLAVDLLRRMFLGAPRSHPRYRPQACNNCQNSWLSVSPVALSYCPSCGGGMGNTD